MISESILTFSRIFGSFYIIESIVPEKSDFASLWVIGSLCCEIDSTSERIAIHLVFTDLFMITLDLTIIFQISYGRVAIQKSIYSSTLWNYNFRRDTRDRSYHYILDYFDYLDYFFSWGLMCQGNHNQASSNWVELWRVTRIIHSCSIADFTSIILGNIWASKNGIKSKIHATWTCYAS